MPALSQFDPPLGKRLFKFAVITDTHLNQGEDDCNSPFAVNRLANRRMRHVIQDLNQRNLKFVINVGDLIHPVPALPALYEKAAECFHQQIEGLEHTIHLVPGNHDIGDKPNDWAPAGGVCNEYIALWEKHFGAHYYAFDYADCHFIVVNAQIINSGLDCENEQREWLEKDLKKTRNKRIFINSHYPPYFSRPDEEENYDNIGEPGRRWLLNLLEYYHVEALFIGHVHNFWYNRFANTDCYLLPSTSFVRQDYSEMYRIKPGPDDQAGRNDKPKLGYFIVHVHQGGHICEIVRTYGQTSASGSSRPPAMQRLAAVHPRLNRHAAFGFDMRHNWMEIVEIPPMGGLDEFDRKEVRNDYPLLALWEMGVRKLRVPMRDLLIKTSRERMKAMKKHGHEFTLFSFGVPSDRDRKLIIDNQDLFTAWEIGINWQLLETIIQGIAEVIRSVNIPVYLSRLRSIDELRSESGRYFHVINQGFLAADVDQLKGLLVRDELKGALNGFVFRLTADREPWTAIQEAAHLAADLGVEASIHLRMCGANPAESTENDLWTSNRLAEAIIAAAVQSNVSVYADTFMDNDRGYFVRNGVLDRLNNPRTGYYIVRNLHSILNEEKGQLYAGVCGFLNGGRYLNFSSSRNSYMLLMPDGSQTEMIIPAHKGAGFSQFDLFTAIVTRVKKEHSNSIRFANNGAVLLRFDAPLD